MDRYYEMQMRIYCWKRKDSFWIEAQDIKAWEIEFLRQLLDVHHDIVLVRPAVLGNKGQWRNADFVELE